MKHTQWIVPAAALVLVGLLSGCETHAQHKKAMVEKWEQSTAEAKLETVDTLLEQGQLAQAEKIVLSCLQSDPDWALAHFAQGRIYLIRERYNSARAAFEKAVAADPQMHDAWSHLAAVCFLEGRNSQALDAYQKAIDLQPDNPEDIVGAAQVYMSDNDLDSAGRLLDQALAKQPYNHQLLLGMAQLHQQAGQTDQAARCYEQALLKTPQNTAILNALGYCYIATKEWARAAETFERLLKLSEDDAGRQMTLSTLAMCEFNAGRYDRALQCYDRLSVLCREDPEVWLNMAQAALAANRIDRAADNAQRALRLKPGWTQAWAVLGAAQYLKGEYTQALRSLAYLRNDDTLGGFGWFMSGRCYSRLGQTAKAQSAYQQAAGCGPNSPLVAHFLPSEAL
jgi:tetratricopeptide (TPR) repeat protein